MAGRKKKTRKVRQVRPNPVPGGAPVEAAPATAPVATAVAPRPQVTSSSSVTAPRRGAVATASGIDIEARVPYFTKDLQQIGIIAAVMVAVIVVASFILK